MLDIPISRRQALQVSGLAALAALTPTFLAARPASAAVGAPHSAASAARSLPRPQLSRSALWYGTPAKDWESQALPIGNARLGAKLFGDPTADVVQFNEQSMWGGVNDYDNALAGQGDGAYDTSVTGFGSYRDFGTVTVSFGGTTTVTSPGGPYRTSGSEGVDRSYDGDSRTKWCIDGPPAQVLWQADLADAAEVASYSLTSANDVPTRDPQEWTFQGSADGSSWTTLDTRTGAPFESRFQTKTYTVANPGTYRHYRFVFVPKAGVSHFQLSEIGLAGVALAGGDGWYVSSPSGHADSLLGSVDGDAGTVWQVGDAPGPHAGDQREAARDGAGVQALAQGDGIGRGGAGAELDGHRVLDAGEHLDDGRLAGAVLTKEADDLAGIEREVEILDRGDAEEALGDVAEFDDGLVAHDGYSRPIAIWRRR